MEAKDPGSGANDSFEEALATAREAPQVAAALDAGDGLRAYGLLRKNLGYLRDPRRRRHIELLLAERRRFLTRAAPPSLHTVNGVGVRFSGSTDPAPDGTYITTLCLVFLFIPVLPISQWLVARAEGGYHVLGKVPPGPIVRKWRAAWGVALLLCLAGGAGFMVWNARHGTVHVVNGFAAPLVVTVDGAAPGVPVPPGRNVARTVTAAAHQVRVSSADGILLDEEKITVPGGGGLVVYNPLGSARLILRDVVYTTEAAPDNAPRPAVREFLGQTLVVLDPPSYLFEAPPEKIEMPKGSAREVRSHFGVVEGGWKFNAYGLADAGKLAQAARLAERAAWLKPDADTVRVAIDLGMAAGKAEGALAVARELIRLRPEAIEAHRGYQDLMEEVGRGAEAVTQYQKRAAAAADSPLWAYLAVRLEEGERALLAFQALVSRFPAYPYARLGYGSSLSDAGRYGEAVEQFGKLAVLDPALAGTTQLRTQRAYAAAGAGRMAEAIALVRPDEGREVHPEQLGLYAQLLRASGKPGPLQHPPEYYWGVRGDEDAMRRGRVYLACVTGSGPAAAADLLALGAQDRAPLELCGLAPADLPKALELSRKAAPEVLSRLRPVVSLLLAGELSRAGDRAAAERVYDAGFRGWRGERAVALRQAVLSGAGAWPRLSPAEMRAAVSFLRSRRATRRDERQRLVLEARRDDFLHGPVTSAIESWPAP